MDIVSIFIFSFVNTMFEIIYSPPPETETFSTAYNNTTQNFLASEYLFRCLIKTTSRWTTFVFIYYFFRRLYSAISSDLLVLFPVIVLCFLGVKYVCRDPNSQEELFFLDSLSQAVQFSFFMGLSWLSLAALWDIFHALISLNGLVSIFVFWIMILGSNILVDALTEYRMSMGSNSYMGKIQDGLKAPFMSQFWCWNNETQSIDINCGRRTETPEASSTFQETPTPTNEETAGDFSSQ